MGNLGLSINVYEPIVRGGEYLFDVTNLIDAYSHTKNANGGYGEASFTIKCSLSEANNWLQDGLGRHIIVNNRGLKACYEGFVNKITISAGPLTVTYGPLLDICNRVSIVYTPILDETADPVVVGDATVTTITENLDSQARFGIFEKVLSTGQALLADVTDAQATYLAEHAWPETSNELNLSGNANEISVSIDCEGYIKWLDLYIYESTPPNVSLWASDKVEDVLVADPNDIISSNYDNISDNLILVPSYEEEQRKASDVIESIVVMGGASADRWLFGVYDDRIAKYSAAPTAQEYSFRIYKGQQIIQDVNELDVQPWDVMPGKWLIMSDFLVGKTPPADIRTDQRAIFIEKVTYTAPYGLAISGAKVSTLSQKLAQLGLGGMS